METKPGNTDKDLLQIDNQSFTRNSLLGVPRASSTRSESLYYNVDGNRLTHPSTVSRGSTIMRPSIKSTLEHNALSPEVLKALPRKKSSESLSQYQDSKISVPERAEILKTTADHLSVEVSYSRNNSVYHSPANYTILAKERYIPLRDDELEIEVDDKLLILHKFADGWILGTNLIRKQTGVFPMEVILGGVKIAVEKDISPVSLLATPKRLHRVYQDAPKLKEMPFYVRYGIFALAVCGIFALFIALRFMQ